MARGAATWTSYEDGDGTARAVGWTEAEIKDFILHRHLDTVRAAMCERAKAVFYEPWCELRPYYKVTKIV
jgi:hypothetical protein